ncbi:MAG: T9SS type A sorting domain-containing protein [Bacteroidales bacterium]|nr:T9SS type A sorting domain-containing protein [Bacteroidales bacterium]MCF8404880.1 T9SS type A sorting domain-containing protein [Bacteroidales bacterium]
MKYFTVPVLFLSILISSLSSAQTLYSDPELATADEFITVYFNSTGTPLENYSGDVYTHSGITIGDNQWQYVIGTWGNNSQQPQLTKISSNLYKLEMDPSIRSFYSAPGSADITELCMVFRSEDAGTQSSDLFLPVFSNELGIVIQSPTEDNVVIIEGDSLLVSAVSPLADSIYLYLNDEEIAAVEGIYIDYTIIAENPSPSGEYQWVKIKAIKDMEMVTDSFSLQVIPPPPVIELPVGMKDGINYLSDTSVLLSLFAPGKDFVFVIGEFNNWEYTLDYYMNITPDGNRYWIEINNLVPGQEYAFQYVIDAYTLIGDPYCEKVLDPWNDQYINNSTYPNLKPYPLSNNQGIMSVLQTNQEEYVWQNTDFEPPAITDLVVYELLVRDFSNQHTFNSLINKIDYFKTLGINAIELMPVNEFEGNLSWGYNPNYYFAVDKYYGPKNTLKAFIDACHAEGIAVILDVVYNHSFGTSPYVLMYWDGASNAPSEDSPFYNVVAKHDYNVGYDMNHESQATKEYISRALKFWLEEFNVDGYRFDLSKGFTQTNTLGNVNQWGQYDQSRINILEAYADSIWAINEDAYVILEHFADNSEEKVLANDGLMIWGNMNYNYLEAAMGWTANSNISWASYQARGWDDPHAVVYMESHDEERMMYKNLTYGNSSNSAHNVKDTTVALRRVLPAAAMFFTIPGPKMIWQFGELGYDYTIDYNGRTGPKPIRWDYYDDYRRKLVYDVYSELINLKTTYATFRTTDFDMSVSGAYKQIALNHAEMDAVALASFNVNMGSMTVNFPHDGSWYSYFEGDTLEVTGNSHMIDLDPGEFRIYTDVKLETPQIGLGTIEHVSGKVGMINNIYPNPAEGNINIDLNVEQSGRVNISVYNLEGQKLALIYSSDCHPGNYTFKWDGITAWHTKVLPGIYFCIVEMDSQREVRKIVIK